MGVSNNMLFTVIMGVINISFTLVAVFTVEKLVPETKGKTLEDMTALWKGKKRL